MRGEKNELPLQRTRGFEVSCCTGTSNAEVLEMYRYVPRTVSHRSLVDRLILQTDETTSDVESSSSQPRPFVFKSISHRDVRSSRSPRFNVTACFYAH
ncbi:uncharacterized [Tachysurus ichikawai]